MRPNTRQDLWRRVERREPGECWPFIGAVNTYGYGQISVSGKQLLAHRLAYELETGVAPGDLLVCHRCDNRRCCNPAHLFLGTCADNSADASRKGRLRHGEDSNFSKLNRGDVRAIRLLAEKGISYYEIGRRFGVTGENVSYIARGLTWRSAS